MALQFFAVHSEALATTHDALQRHASSEGLRPPGPTRALRIAQLYGYLQLRAAGRSSFLLALSDLAASWRFQPRQLRQDLALLQALGWLSARGTTRGTVISLSGPDVSASIGPADLTAAQSSPPPAAVIAVPTNETGQPAEVMPARPAGTAPASADPAPAPPASAPESTGDDSRDLLQRLAGLYNQHRPSTWPVYQPRGNGLRSKLRQALRQAGSADALADTLTAALRAMPAFWRHTYPQGRSGAECMAVLFCTDRGCAGLGVEFWHLFSWAQAAAGSAAAREGECKTPLDPGSAGATETDPEEALQRARRLFLWDSGVWRSQGCEALLLSQRQKRELAQLLEASGEGIHGTAERQFADPESLPAPIQDQGTHPARDSGATEELTGSTATYPPGSHSAGIPPSEAVPSGGLQSAAATQPGRRLGSRHRPNTAADANRRAFPANGHRAQKPCPSITEVPQPAVHHEPPSPERPMASTNAPERPARSLHPAL